MAFIPLAIGGAIGATAIFLNNRLSFRSCEEVAKVAQPGDLIEFDRGAYSHYALYLGRRKHPGYSYPVPLVLNICAEDKNHKEALIKVELLSKVCGKSKARVRNHDKIAARHFGVSPRPLNEIMEAVKSYKNRTVQYQFDNRNCEYYATLWRYGKGFSTQVSNWTTTPAGMYVKGIANSNFFGEVLLGTATTIREAAIYKKYRDIRELD